MRSAASGYALLILFLPAIYPFLCFNLRVVPLVGDVRMWMIYWVVNGVGGDCDRSFGFWDSVFRKSHRIDPLCRTTDGEVSLVT